MAQHIHRLQRDLRELSSHDFDCSASNVLIQAATNENNNKSITHLLLCIREGPYAEAHYVFKVMIPESFPFKCPQIFSTTPIWHPNIELNTGLVTLPLEWTPDLRLVDLALNLQMLMLNPSCFAVANIEASLAHNQDSRLFYEQIRSTLHGGHFAGIDFPPITSRCVYCKNHSHIPKVVRRISIDSTCSSTSSRKRRNQEMNIDKATDILTDIFDVHAIRGEETTDYTTASVERRRRKIDPIIVTSTATIGTHNIYPEIVPSVCLNGEEKNSWDSYNSTSMMSQEDALEQDTDTEPVNNEYFAEWSDKSDSTLFLLNRSLSAEATSYRTYSAKSERRSMSSPDLIENLPIMRHIPNLTKQIARSASTDEWDANEGVSHHNRRRSVFRRTAVSVYSTAANLSSSNTATCTAMITTTDSQQMSII